MDINLDYMMYPAVDDPFPVDKIMFVTIACGSDPDAWRTDDSNPKGWMTDEEAAVKIGRYLPDNYRTHIIDYQMDGDDLTGRFVCIVHGTDVAGWTAEDHVIPRLAAEQIEVVYRSWQDKEVK